MVLCRSGQQEGEIAATANTETRRGTGGGTCSSSSSSSSHGGPNKDDRSRGSAAYYFCGEVMPPEMNVAAVDCGCCGPFYNENHIHTDEHDDDGMPLHPAAPAARITVPVGTYDPYQVLHLRRDATTGEIKQAYKRLAVLHYPERRGGDASNNNNNHNHNNHNNNNSSGQFAAISAAYETLIHAETRQCMDDILFHGVHSSSTTTGAKNDAAVGGKSADIIVSPILRRKQEREIRKQLQQERRLEQQQKKAERKLKKKTRDHRATTNVPSIVSSNMSSTPTSKSLFATIASPQTKLRDEDLKIPVSRDEETTTYSVRTDPTSLDEDLVSDPIIPSVAKATLSNVDKRCSLRPSRFFARCGCDAAAAVDTTDSSSSDDDDDEKDAQSRASSSRGGHSLSTSTSTKRSGKDVRKNKDDSAHESLPPLLQSSSSTSTTNEDVQHYSSVATERLFGGPLQLMYRARRWQPFTDPYVIFKQVFGSALVVKKVDGQTAKRNHHPGQTAAAVAVSTSAAWTGSSVTLEDGTVVSTNSRVVAAAAAGSRQPPGGPRLMTRTITRFPPDPVTGLSRTTITVTSKDVSVATTAKGAAEAAALAFPSCGIITAGCSQCGGGGCHDNSVDGSNEKQHPLFLPWMISGKKKRQSLSDDAATAVTVMEEEDDDTWSLTSACHAWLWPGCCAY